MKKINEKVETWRAKGFIGPDTVDTPPEEKMSDGPVAVIECPQKIPCNPCKESCPVGAIEMESLNGIPSVNFDKCTGCSLCVESCPGLAIFTIDCSLEAGCKVTLPYEFKLPSIGEEVLGLNRKGEPVTEVKVKDVKTRKESKSDTPTVTVKVQKDHAMDVRNIRRLT
ncbi:MAG: 4Fe-4S binding protein [Candidatus Bipolaricaulia bacterium]